VPLNQNENQLSQNRIRVYSIGEAIQGCPLDRHRIHTWLVIDDAQLNDTYLSISLHAGYTTYNYRIKSLTMDLNLIPGKTKTICIKDLGTDQQDIIITR